MSFLYTILTKLTQSSLSTNLFLQISVFGFQFLHSLFESVQCQCHSSVCRKNKSMEPVLIWPGILALTS